MRGFGAWACVLFVMAGGCDDDGAPPDADGVDAGAPVDGGDTARDAGPGTDAGEPVDAGAMSDAGAPPPAGSLEFFDRPGDDDYAQLTTLPSEFGAGELTFEMWLRPSASDARWFGGDPMPYDGARWWANGNWVLDGHNNSSMPEAMRVGTFDLMFYGGGRMRWLLHDGDQLWGVQAFPATDAPAINDGQWHHVAAVRRFVGASGASLELWVDGTEVGEETVPGRNDLRPYWNPWPGPMAQQGWFFGGEKRSAVGSGGYQYDYAGEVAEVRFWTVARSTAALRDDWRDAIAGNEAGLVGWYRFGEGSGDSACNALASSECMALTTRGFTTWSSETPPLE